GPATARRSPTDAPALARFSLFRRRMRAATLVAPGRFALDDVPPPQPGPGQVLLAVQGCGVCGSDMGPWRGVAGISYPLAPGAPGHEVFGTVAALGPGVDGGLAVGDPVTALALRAGADLVLGYDDDVDGRIAALTGGRLADVVIEATGRQEPLDLAARLVRVRGRLVVAGYHQDGARTVDMQLWNWRGLDVV